MHFLLGEASSSIRRSMPKNIGTVCYFNRLQGSPYGVHMSIRKIAAAIMVCATCSNAIAEDAPLAVGKPAGTQKAALAGGSFVILLGLAGVIAATATMLSQSNNKGLTTPTTSTTGTGV